MCVSFDAYRETKGKEAVNGFFNFCETAEALPKSLTGKAVSYAINQKNNLKIYDYLVWLFENIHILPKTELLPWSSKIPPNIRKG